MMRWPLIVVAGALATIIFGAAGCGSRKPVQTAIATSGPAVASTGPSSQPAELEFRSDVASVCFEYPSAWKPMQGDTILRIAPAAGDAGGQRFIAFDYPDVPFHLPGMVKVGLVQGGFVNDGLKTRLQNVNVDDQKPWPIPDAKARYIHATASDGQKAVCVNAVLAVHDDRVYIFDAECDPAFEPNARATMLGMVASVQWLKK